MDSEKTQTAEIEILKAKLAAKDKEINELHRTVQLLRDQSSASTGQDINFYEKPERSLFENNLVAMFRIHADSNIILQANNKLWAILGYRPQEMTNTQFDFFKNRRDQNRFKDTLKEKGKIENEETEIQRPDGNLIWVSFSAIYRRGENVFEYILTDITQTKESLMELQKVNFELDSFIYHASHDLRSPLRSIIGLIEVYRLEENEQVKRERKKKIEGSVKRLDHLVMELLSISRNDRINDPHVEVNFMIEINNSVSSYFNASNNHGLEILTKVKQPVKFGSDLTRVRIILNNLISNAIKYRSPEKEKSYILVEVEANDKFARLKVEDNGEGIESSKVPHIFDMFYRATERSEGSGLGLYIVKRVAQKLNAKIEVYSEELEGSTFVVTIPNTVESLPAENTD